MERKAQPFEAQGKQVATLQKNSRFRDRMPSSSKSTGSEDGTNDESEKKYWQSTRKGCALGGAGPWVVAGGGAAGGSAGSCRAGAGEAAAEDSGAAGGASVARISG